MEKSPNLAELSPEIVIHEDKLVVNGVEIEGFPTVREISNALGEEGVRRTWENDPDFVQWDWKESGVYGLPLSSWAKVAPDSIGLLYFVFDASPGPPGLSNFVGVINISGFKLTQETTYLEMRNGVGTPWIKKLCSSAYTHHPYVRQDSRSQFSITFGTVKDEFHPDVLALSLGDSRDALDEAQILELSRSKGFSARELDRESELRKVEENICCLELGTPVKLCRVFTEEFYGWEKSEFLREIPFDKRRDLLIEKFAMNPKTFRKRMEEMEAQSKAALADDRQSEDVEKSRADVPIRSHWICLFKPYMWPSYLFQSARITSDGIEIHNRITGSKRTVHVRRSEQTNAVPGFFLGRVLGYGSLELKIGDHEETLRNIWKPNEIRNKLLDAVRAG